MPLTAQLSVSVKATNSTAFGLSNPVDRLEYKRQFNLENGTGANQGDLMFHDTRTIVASGSHNYDLNGDATFLDAFGNQVDFVRLHTVIIESHVSNPGFIQFKAPVAENRPEELFFGTGDGIRIPPGGFFFVTAGPDATAITIGDATDDIVVVSNESAAGPATFDIVMLGASA